MSTDSAQFKGPREIGVDPVQGLWWPAGLWLLAGAYRGLDAPDSALVSLGIVAVGWLLFGAVHPMARPAAEAVHGLLGLALLVAPQALSAGDNEPAGALALFLLPWTARLFTARGVERALWLLPVGGAWIRLAELGSRGGLLAAAVGTAVFLALASPLGRGAVKRGALTVAAGLGTVAVLAPGALHRLALAALLEGRPRGLTLSGALSGRPEIWWRSAVAAADLPLGIGPGAFPRVMHAAYPGAASSVDHAHQALLQLVLTWGFPGALALGILAAAGALGAVKALHRIPLGSPERPWAAGLVGAWAGCFCFATFDTLPLHRPASFGLWTLLALSAAGRPLRRRRVSWPAVVLVGTLALGTWLSPQDLRRRAVLRALDGPPGALTTATEKLEGLAEPGDGDLWLAGVARHHLGDAGRRDEAWQRLIERDDRRLPLLIAHPGSRRSSLAEVATERHPTSCLAWWWSARSRDGSPEDADEALEGMLEAYRRALALCPNRPRLQLEGADHLAAAGLSREALDAYERACLGGDPGANACLRGGRLARTLGDEARARRLLARSRLASLRP